MNIYDKVEIAKNYIQKKMMPNAKIALILGSGLINTNTTKEINIKAIIKYDKIPYWPKSTVDHHIGELLLGEVDGTEVIIMSGRVHYYEGYSMSEITFPIRVLREIGVETLIVTNAAGGVSLNMKPGTIMLIDDHINLMGANPLIGLNEDKWGERYPDMTYPYNIEYISIIEKVAKQNNIHIEKGTYLAMTGPSFETPAEIKMIRLLGGDVVGMSTVPEVIVANHMNMKVCGLSCVSNYAAGITKNRLTLEEVIENVDLASSKIMKLLTSFIREIYRNV
ncbi:MAG: purine-nucleoside phosphorylase [Synergistaceae bacterium]